MSTRKLKFINDSLKILNQLNSEWFPSSSKSPEGYNYACLYCDQGCSRHESHDDDCFLQLAKETLIKIKAIEDSDLFNLNFKGIERDTNEITLIKQNEIFYCILNSFFIPKMNELVPLDLLDIANKGVCCTCHMYAQEDRKHDPDCIHQKLALILSELFKP